MSEFVPTWRSALFTIFLAIWSMGLGFLSLPMLIFARKHVPFLYRIWAPGAVWALKVLCGITYQIKGAEHILQNGVIVASKHQSAMDICVLTHIFYKPSYVLKRELTWIPFWGWMLRGLQNIPINRSKGRESMQAINVLGKKLLHAGRALIVFPEGTRVPVGEKRKYQPGVALMVDELMVPVVPVALNTGIFWPKSGRKRPGVATIEFLPTIQPGLKPRVFLKTLEEQIESKAVTLTA